MVAKTTIWQAVLGELEVTISKAHFKTWLRNAQLASLSDSVATIHVPNIFVRSWVESHYKQQFLTSFQKHIPTIIEVVFDIPSGKEPKSIEEEASEAIFVAIPPN